MAGRTKTASELETDGRLMEEVMRGLDGLSPDKCRSMAGPPDALPKASQTERQLLEGLVELIRQRVEDWGDSVESVAAALEVDPALVSELVWGRP